MNDRFVAKLLATAVLLQGLVLLVMGRIQGRAAVQTLVVAAALALLVHEAWRFRLTMNHRIDMALVMAGFGGLGMILGWWFDLRSGPHAGAMAGAALRGHGVHAGMSLVSFMTVGMLLAAVPPGFVLTRCARLARRGPRRWISTHIVGNVAMVMGMVWLGRLLTPAFTAVTASRLVAMHLAMVVGMVVGMEAGMFLGEAALGLEPWREFTWGAGRRTWKGAPRPADDRFGEGGTPR